MVETYNQIYLSVCNSVMDMFKVDQITLLLALRIPVVK